MMPTAKPVETFAKLWASGQGPDLEAFAREFGALPLAQLAEIVCMDQARRWQPSVAMTESSSATFKYSPPARVLAEAYFERFPELRSNAELAVAIVVGEYQLREKMGQRPRLEEYRSRFPDHARDIDRHIEQQHVTITEKTVQPSATVAEPSSGPKPLPEVFGRYHIRKKLGEGGMGTVYLAEDSQLQRLVALKVPYFDGSDGPIMIERFYREARAAATFHHPNLCPVYDIGQIDGTHYLTMPYLSGESMGAWLKQVGALPPAQACRMARKIAEAMHVAHEAGVLHRDLKPANIMLPETPARAEPEPVVMDFGLARRNRDRDAQLTGQGVMIGTGAYMPPEQICGDGARIGRASDVYSLGVILFQMLAGRTPFKGQLHDVLRGVLSQDPPSPRRFRPDLDPALEAICLKAIAKDPEHRYASMAELAAALAPFCAEGGEVAEKSTPVSTAATPVRHSSKAGLVALLGVAAALIGAAFWAFVLPHLRTLEAPKDKESPNPLALANANGTSDPKPLETKPESKIDSKPETKPETQPETKPEIKPETKPEVKPETKPEVKPEMKPEVKPEAKPDTKVESKPDVPKSTLVTLKGHKGAVRTLAFHPKDSNQLATGSDDRLIHVWDIAAQKHRVLKGNPGPVLSVAFDPSGQHLASAGGDSQKLAWNIVVWDTAEGRALGDLKGHFSHVNAVAFSQDGKLLASAATDNTIGLWDVEKRKSTKSLLGDQAFNAVAFHPKDNFLASGGNDETVRLWDLESGTSKVLEGHERPVLAVAFSPDGKTLASASDVNHLIKLWDPVSARNTATLEGHRGTVHAIAFNLDGTLLATASADRTVKLWDVAAAKCVATFDKHSADVFTVSFSPDGRTLASGSKDGLVLVWPIPSK